MDLEIAFVLLGTLPLEVPIGFPLHRARGEPRNRRHRGVRLSGRERTASRIEEVERAARNREFLHGVDDAALGRDSFHFADGRRLRNRTRRRVQRGLEIRSDSMRDRSEQRRSQHQQNEREGPHVPCSQAQPQPQQRATRERGAPRARDQSIELPRGSPDAVVVSRRAERGHGARRTPRGGDRRSLRDRTGIRHHGPCGSVSARTRH